MSTWTAFTTLAGQAPAEALGAALERLAPAGVGVFEIEDGAGRWEVAGYFTAPPDEIALALLAAAHGAGDFVVSELPETDWVAKVRRDLAPVVAGRFFVHGAHDADRVPAGAVPLLIEAAMAFGTGHHGTTKGCLLALDRMVGAGVRAQRVADIGCGTAVLAMAAKRVWPEAEVHASDIDAVAIDVAEANLAANRMSGAVVTHVAAGFDHPDLAEAGLFDLVFANILKGPLIDLAPDLVGALRPGGQAILSGLLNAQANEVVDVYRRLGTNLLERREIVDWTTLVIEKSG
ncbi:MAG: 50S ribosomal protein L11 methyltransferase [Paracoccaceae bacterium]|nr:50S ribosomal protein L11 methyltransferase [Paracoccaceae bacterium]